MTARDFAAGFIRDPITQDGSSTRLAALLATLAGCVAAVIGAVTGHDTAAIVGACLGGGAFQFFTRTRSDATPGAES